MATTIELQLKNSNVAGRVPVPADFTFEGAPATGVLLINSKDGKMYALADDLTTVVCLGDATKLAGAIQASQIGAANGVAALDAGGKVPLSQLPALATTGLRFKGLWNASIGTAPAASPAEGEFWIVSTAGTTALSGISDWQPKDWAVFTGAAWEKVDNSEPAPITAITGGTF